MTKQTDTREAPALSPETITMHLTMCASNSTVESLVQRWAVHTKSAEYSKTVKDEMTLRQRMADLKAEKEKV